MFKAPTDFNFLFYLFVWYSYKKTQDKKGLEGKHFFLLDALKTTF